MKKLALILLAACADADSTLVEPLVDTIVIGEDPIFPDPDRQNEQPSPSQCTAEVIEVEVPVEVPVEVEPEPAAPIYFRILDRGLELCSLDSLDFALDSAIARWRSAACLPLQRSQTEGHSFQWSSQEDMSQPDRLAQTNGTWQTAKVQLVAEAMCPDTEGSFDHASRAVAHEMWHILARTNGHLENDSVADSGGNGDWSRFDAPINEEVLSRVCAKQDCKCFYPED